MNTIRPPNVSLIYGADFSAASCTVFESHRSLQSALLAGAECVRRGHRHAAYDTTLHCTVTALHSNPPLSTHYHHTAQLTIPQSALPSSPPHHDPPNEYTWVTPRYLHAMHAEMLAEYVKANALVLMWKKQYILPFCVFGVREHLRRVTGGRQTHKVAAAGCGAPAEAFSVLGGRIVVFAVRQSTWRYC